MMRQPTDDGKRVAVWLLVVAALIGFRSMLVGLLGPMLVFLLYLTVGLMGIGLAIDLMRQYEGDER